MENVVESTPNGIIIRTEKMEKEKIYVCIHEGKVFLFFKNILGVLSCYEVKDKDLEEKIKLTPDHDSVMRIISELVK